MSRSTSHALATRGYKFLAKHYPVRSQAHDERKVCADRAPRPNTGERELGWHHHYDAVTDGHRFVRDPDDLLLFDADAFAGEYVVERLTGVGILRGPSRSAA